MNSDYFCYLNKELVHYKNCSMHISDLLFQRGYGVFDFLRCRNGNFPWLDDYIERLFNSINLSGIEVSLKRDDIKSMIFDLQEKNRDENGAFKIIVTGGFSTTLDAVQGESNFIIMNVPWRKPSQESFDKGVNLISYDYLRHDPEIKTLNYFNTLKLRQKLKEYSAVDVLFHNDYLSEVSRANVFLVKGDNIFTPASNILKGITRNQILSLIEGIHIEDIPFASLYEYDEMFITSTTRDITPVVSVDGKIIGKGEPGKVTKEIMRAFDV